ncbi:MAG: hypothetical protein FMNOHCHN_01768 [Ignavibacteriaceae bacterium]|nr:hypothetical protein [Ignavibacteriaceae bacterium]
MSNFHNLNTLNSGLPFKWYPVTELFRDFLREKTVAEGICLHDRSNGKYIRLDEGIDRDIFIDNYLVSDVDFFDGKIYCRVCIDDLMMLGRQSVSMSVYEAIKAAPHLRKDPFTGDNSLFELLERDVLHDGEDFERNLEKMETFTVQHHIAVVKLISMRIGDKDFADKYMGNLIADADESFSYDELLEMVKISALMLGDKKSAERLFKFLAQTEGAGRNHTERAAVQKYILGKKTENAEILQACFASAGDQEVFLNDLLFLSMYFDTNYAADLWKKGVKQLSQPISVLTAAIYAEFILGNISAADKLLSAAKEKADNLDWAVSFSWYAARTGKEREFAAGLAKKYPPYLSDNNIYIALYLRNVKYLSGDVPEYNRVVQELVKTDMPSFDLIDIAMVLISYNTLADDLDIFYHTAKERAEEAEDFISLARWALEADPSKEREAGELLRKASELCEHYIDHMNLGILLSQNHKTKYAESHLRTAYELADDADALLNIAGAWMEMDRKEEAKKALRKGEKFAVNAEDLKNLGMVWMTWFNDRKASERCIAKSVDADWNKALTTVKPGEKIN